MNTTERARTCAQFMRDNREDFGCLKTDMQAAVNSLDDFLTNNAAAINTAIPQPARGAMTTAQKLTLIAYVALRRAGKLKAKED